MSNADRIEKFFSDQLTVLSAYNRSKVSSEIGKLKQWLVKHQDEVIPDASKQKLLSILERYNRAAGNFADIRSSVSDLFSDYLQMPEGKLVSAKDKSKVLKWIQNIGATTDDDSCSSGGATVVKKASRWTVESIDEAKKTVTLLSTEDEELWKEDFAVESALFNQIKASFDAGSSCVVEIGDSGNKLVSS